MKLSELKTGEKAIVKAIDDTSLGMRLMEMGLLPGEELVVEFVAPLGDPIAISVAGYQLSIRKSDAETISVDFS